MSDLFKAKRPDGRSDWRVVFDRVAQLQPGEEISHKELLEELGTTDRTVLYRAVPRANRELWKTKLRSLDAVRGKGYRLLHANEHIIQAERYKTKSRRQMGNALAVMEATDLSPDCLGPVAPMAQFEVHEAAIDPVRMHTATRA
jgi:hypothetical protein